MGFNKKHKRVYRRSPYSQQYINERREQMLQLIAKAQTETERENIRKAFDISIRP